MKPRLEILSRPLRSVLQFLTLAMVLLLPLSGLKAEVIFSDSFSGSAKPVTLSGFAPDVRPDNEQWIARTTLYANGRNDTYFSRAWLPVTLENDQVYTLSTRVSVNYLVGNDSQAGIGFTIATDFNDHIGNSHDATDVGVLEILRNGGWLFHAVDTDGGIASEPKNTLFTSSQTDYEVKLVLTTSSTQPWKLDAFLGGVQRDLAPADETTLSYEFPSVPAITGAGFNVVSGTYATESFLFEGPLAPVPVETSSRVVDVFFLAGQSNASGRVNTGYSPDPRDAKVLYYYQTDGPSTSDVTSGGQFVPLQPLASGYYGPEISMARELVTKGYRPAIIKVSDGGTDLFTDWNSTSYGPLWKNWLSSTTDALKKLKAMGCVVKVRGFLWLQGETDAGSSTKVAVYESNFEDLLANVRAKLTDEGLDLSNLQNVTALIRISSGDHSDIVRDALKTVTDAQPSGSWFDNEDLSMRDDNLHFDAPSIAIIGERFAAPFDSKPTYADWATGHELSGELAAPTADPDGNGIANLTEYALDIEHGSESHIGLPVAAVTDQNLSIDYHILHADVIYQPEWSIDLTNWSSYGIAVTRDDFDALASFPVTDHPLLFMRLKFLEN